MIREFELTPFPEAYRVQIKTKPVRGIYRSLKYPNLRVIDKENGGSKADASNAGINAARYPIFYCGDADSILDPGALEHVVRPFLEDPTHGRLRRHRAHHQRLQGARRRARGSRAAAQSARAGAGRRVPARLPRRAASGWSAINGMLIVSGAFGVFHRDTVVEAGGYRHDAIGEDMELIVRLHRMLVKRGQRYRVAFIPDPVCWTDAPEDIGDAQEAAQALAARARPVPVVQSRALLHARQPRGGVAGVPVLRRVRAAEPAGRSGGPRRHGRRVRAGHDDGRELPRLHARGVRARAHALDDLAAARGAVVPHLPEGAAPRSCSSSSRSSRTSATGR